MRQRCPQGKGIHLIWKKYKMIKYSLNNLQSIANFAETFQRMDNSSLNFLFKFFSFQFFSHRTFAMAKKCHLGPIIVDGLKWTIFKRRQIYWETSAKSSKLMTSPSAIFNVRTTNPSRSAKEAALWPQTPF